MLLRSADLLSVEWGLAKVSLSQLLDHQISKTSQYRTWGGALIRQETIETTAVCLKLNIPRLRPMSIVLRKCSFPGEALSY